MADADSLTLFIDNTEPLYRQKRAVMKNMALKKARGVYDSVRAPQAFAWLVERGAQEFVKEERETRPWHVVFPAKERLAAAKDFAGEFEGEWANPAERERWVAQLPAKYRGGKFAEQLSAVDTKARRRGGYTLADLNRMSVVSEGHSGNLMVDTGKTRVWLSRLTKEDGAKFDHEVSVETLGPKGWRTITTYGAKADRGGKKVALAALEAAERAWARSRSTGASDLGANMAVANAVADAQKAGASRAEIDRAKQRGLRLGASRASRHESGKNPRVKKKATRTKKRRRESAPMSPTLAARLDRALGKGRRGR